MKPNIGQGDSGKTNLIGFAEKVLKSNRQIECIGALDELVSLIGFVKVKCRYKNILVFLEKIQDHLFRLESLIAGRGKKTSGFPRMSKEHIKFLERAIEKYEKDLPELQNFILPGGGELASLLHIARTETRRVERILVRASQKQKLHPFALPYLNRLSDVFFALSRWVNFQSGQEETKWVGVGRKDI